ncbi:MAG: hydroxyquinol 1,2-dioxygenase [Actinobacteria bacterium]|nr:hydroxyquinol 1,2-dioxygenase [Actinomycetota bacterium]
MGTPSKSGGVEKSAYTTVLGSLDSYDKGGVELINDDARHYAFSNIFEVASKSAPWEKVAVAKNFEYVLEAVRAEGTSQWRTAAHDEFVVCLDGAVTVELVKLDASPLAPDAGGSIALDGEPTGRPMGRIHLARGHQALLPSGAAYRFSAPSPAVLMMQTIAGPDTQFRWAEICQTV